MTDAVNGLTLTPYDPTMDEQLKAGREFMCEFRAGLAEFIDNALSPVDHAL